MAVSARFGRVGVGTEITFRANTSEVIRLTDRVTGQFRENTGAFQRALSQANAQAALVVQQGMADELKSRVKKTGRRQRGTDYLNISIMHENNRDVTASSFMVGRESWLDRSPAALYWRRIEFGDAATFDSFILFTNNFSSYYGPWSPGGRSKQGGSWQGSEAKGYSRKQPPGYKHMRMPQHKGAFVQNIGPYPEYAFSRVGGTKAFRRLNMRANYEKYLAQVGINITDVLRKK